MNLELYKMLLKKFLAILAGVTTLAGTGALPIVPTSMTYVTAYSYPAKDAQYVEQANSSATSTLVGAYNIKTVYKDIDGDGWIANAVFRDSNGNLVVVQIPHSQYKKMTEDRGGEAFNPTRTQFTNVFQALATPVSAAIAWDASSSAATVTATSQTWAHTVTGSNTVLFLYVWVNSSDAAGLQTATFNGTRFATTTSVTTYLSGTNWAWMMQLAAPTSGTHNIVINLKTSVASRAQASSYTGAAQTGIPDSSNTSGGDGTSDSFTMSTTVVAANSWLIMGNDNIDSGTCAVGTGTRIVGNNNPILSDSNSAVAAGSRSLSLTSCGNRVEDKIILSFAPFVAPLGGVPDQPLIILQDE